MNPQRALLFILLFFATAAACQAAEHSVVNDTRQMTQQDSQAGDTIGSAEMKADGSLVLQLVARSYDGCTIGDALFRYAPGDPDYEKVLRHVGPLKPGESAFVGPWPDTARGQNATDNKTLLATIQAQLEKADAEITAQSWEAANKRLKTALNDLGGRYYDPKVIDDSSLKLSAACIRENEGKLDNAVRVRRRILAERLDLLRSKIR